MNRKFRKQSTSGNSKVLEVCKTKSETTPDMSLTVREIMIKYASGTINDLALDYDYSEDDEDFRGLDPAEIHMMAQESGLIVKKAKDDKEKAETAKRKKAEKEAIIAEYQKTLNQPNE